MPGGQSFTGVRGHCPFSPGNEHVCKCMGVRPSSCDFHHMPSALAAHINQLWPLFLLHLASFASHKKRHRKVNQLYISYTEGQNVLWADANNRGNTNGSARKPWTLTKNFKSRAKERADKREHNTVRKHKNGGRWIVRDEWGWHTK